MPGVPQLGRRGQERPGPIVAVGLSQVAATAEVLPGEGVPGGDHVPRRAAAGQVVEAGELAGYLIRLVERGVDRAGQPDVLGHRGQGGQDGEGVRPADHVEVVDRPVLLAQPQPFGQEHEVELASLGGLRELAERVELDVAARGRIAPHGGVVHAGKMRGQVDLLGHGRCPRIVAVAAFRRRRSGGGVAVGGAAQAEPPAQRVGLVGGAEHAAALQLGDQQLGELRQVMRQGTGRSRKPDSPAACQSCSRSARPAAVPV